MKKVTICFSALLLFCFSAFAQKSDTITLNLLNPTYPSSFIFTDKGCWNQTYNEVDYNTFTSQIFSFTHNIEGAGSCYGGYAWSGFTVCNSGDNTNHSTQGWAMNYEWGCMAGGGIKTDGEGNVLIDGNGDVIVEKGLPYLVSYWKFMIDPLWWHLGFGNTFINAPVHCLKILLDEDEEYEAVGVYVNNHPWTYYSNKYGDYARPLNQEGDYVKLFFHGLHPDGTESGKNVEFLLAKYENGQLYQNEKWEWLDLSSLGVIGGIYCTMETTICSITGGPQSPTYFCMDKLQVRTKDTLTHVPVNDFNNIKIYSHRNCVYIKNVELQYIASSIKANIYDMFGRLVYQNVINNTETIVPLPFVSGIYNVVLNDRDLTRRLSTKVLIVND